VDSRKNEYAILRAVGSKKDDITKLVMGEFLSIVLMVVLISVLLGLAFGSFLSYMTFNLSPYTPLLSRPLYIPFYELGVIALLQSLLMAISCLVPIRIANQTDPAVQLRNL
jgi:ABC-type lipoprotein release transport system permease subunit